MKLRNVVSGAVIAAFFISLGQPTALKAQSILDLRVGDTPSKLSRLGPVSGEDKYKKTDVFKWILPNRNSLTANVDAEGEIVYLESEWGGKTEDTGCDLAGLKFGVTTLEDLRKRFGSSGFGYRKRLHVTQTADGGVVLLNSWEVEGVVITFTTRISGPDYAKAQAGGADADASGYARLQAISMANAAYAKEEWGARMPAPAYKKIEWK